MTHANDYLARTNQLFDSTCALAVMLVTFAWLNMERIPGGIEEFLSVRLTVRNLTFGVLLIVIWHSCFALCGLYRGWRRDQSRAALAMRIVAACTIASGLVSLFTLASASGSFRLEVVLAFWLVATGMELTGRGTIATVGHYLRASTREIKPAVIVGSGPRALSLVRAIESGQISHCELIGLVDTVGDRTVPAEIASRMIGTLEEFETLLATRPIGQVLIALPVKSCYVAIQQAIDICERVGVEVTYFPDLFSVSLARREYAQDEYLPSVRLQLVADDYRLIVKRVIDVAAAAIGLAILAPLFLVCAVMVKRSSPGPVFFTQVRYGYNRRLFRMFKFRTMVQDAETLQGSLEAQNEACGPIFKIRADPRITRVGRIMRKLSLDELPQLVNVLRGDMSLVGPRPMSMRDVSRFSESWLLRRFSVKPGVTCLWQVNGRSNVGFDRWVELDLAYIDNWSLALDMRILIKTVPAVLSGSGAM